MIEIKRVSSCPLTDVVEAWNSGFKGYFTEMTMTVDRFIQRMVHEGLSAEDSIVAYVDGVPAGIVLNGFRIVDGKTISYNGGTGVAPEFRRTGIGKKMMESTIEIYKRKAVDTATLEAINENSAAIKLYESLGYEITDRVDFLQQDGPLQPHFEDFEISPEYDFEHTTPEQVSKLSFYQKESPWQTQWQSAANGEAVVASQEGKQVGYALYRRSFKPDGNAAVIVLHQLGVDADFNNPYNLIDALLHKVLEPKQSCKRLIINLSREAKPQYETVMNRGFSTMISQVCMEKVIKEPIESNAKSIEKV
ncbi:GNAT family N-acetyltransferase [Bacillus sp. Marseille-Q3570]|uniref:GNAT family N-acetyltransferase n=1 Tax=Bacillus sp. Marseille-Q3570 TaxID=2963522 RepID=UPI0021B7D979|nr:N-acetyltransferase [Bacillus sp. Marseille-Q3570]